MRLYISEGEDLSFLDQAGFQPTQKRVSAQTIEDYRNGIKNGQPFWAKVYRKCGLNDLLWRRTGNERGGAGSFCF